MIVMLLCFTAFAGRMAHAQTAQTVEDAIGDVDAAYQAAPEAASESSAPRKLFQSNSSKAKSTKKKSRDFVEVHKPTRKQARKTTPQKPRAAVEANDLMDGMRESLDPNALAPNSLAPNTQGLTSVDAADANAATPQVPAGQQIIQPLSSGQLFQTGKTTAAANSLPAVTPSPSSPTQLTPPEVKAAPTAITSVAPIATVGQATKDAPKKDVAKIGAPLLSELSEAPTGAENVKGVATPAAVTATTAPAPTAEAPQPKSAQQVADSFSKARTLFSAPSDKRKRPGVSRVASVSPFFADESVLPPVSAPAVAEPMIKPVAAAPETVKTESPETKSIWSAPKPEMTKGKVLYSQSADGQAPVADSAPSSAPIAPVVTETTVTEATVTETGEPVVQSLVDASCGAAHGVGVSAPPATNLCAQGNATTVIGRGPFMWTCQSADGNKTVECAASHQINAVCGPADGVAVNAAPSTNLCRLGLASAVTGNGPFVWSCAGSGGGVNDNCGAPLAKSGAEENKVVDDGQLADNKSPDAVAEPKTTYKDIAVPSKLPEPDKATSACVPTVKRWTITCREGGYPANYTGVIVGETQILCPTNVERGVWLTNSCAAPANSVPVSKSPGKLEVPSKSKTKLTDMLPNIAPMPSQKLEGPRKLFTPHFKRGSASGGQTTEDITTINFVPTSEALDAQAIRAIDAVVSALLGDDKSIITLNAYAAVPADGDQQESRRLALARALAVRSYLMRKAIPSKRIDVRAVGPAGDTYGDDRVDIKVK